MGVWNFSCRSWKIFSSSCFCLLLSRQDTGFTAVHHMFRSCVRMPWHDPHLIPVTNTLDLMLNVLCSTFSAVLPRDRHPEIQHCLLWTQKTQSGIRVLLFVPSGKWSFSSWQVSAVTLVSWNLPLPDKMQTPEGITHNFSSLDVHSEYCKLNGRWHCRLCSTAI